jgi:tRNA pseudouridine38-40 synthase
MAGQHPSVTDARVRLRLDLGYDGTRFVGWARQPGLRTVQGEVETALATVLRQPPEGVALTCAGRTDAGVHARGQVCHLDIGADGVDGADSTSAASGEAVARPDRLVRRLNALLPDDIAVHAARLAPAGFDARFSAIHRHYTYRLVDSAAALDPLRRAEICRWRRPLDHAAMAEAASHLVGLHDFAAFCRPRPGATTIRHLTELTCRRTPAGVLEVDLHADAFCHSMVRAIVGALVAVGEGRRRPDWVGEVVRARRRDSSVRVMPAGGLTLEAVGYPADDELAARAQAARAVRTLPTDAAPSGPVDAE